MRIFVWVLSLTVLCLGPNIFAETDSPLESSTPVSGTLRVVTYNVQFLPGIASSHNERKDPFYRAERIAKELSSFDLVVLQEVFHEEHRERLLETLREEWNGNLNSVLSPTPKGRFTSGGCLIATRLPILESTSTVFENYSRIRDYGLRADGFAAKGVIRALVLLNPEDPRTAVDIFATHLEARDDNLRPLQYQEMTDFLREQSAPDRPLLLLGDFNTYGMAEYEADPKSQYSQLLTLLNESRPKAGFIDVWRRLRGKDFGGTTEQDSTETGKRIDYIFLSNPNPPALQLKPVSIRINPHPDPRVIALSDHNAVEAEFEWSKN